MVEFFSNFKFIMYNRAFIKYNKYSCRHLNDSRFEFLYLHHQSTHISSSYYFAHACDASTFYDFARRAAVRLLRSCTSSRVLLSIKCIECTCTHNKYQKRTFSHHTKENAYTSEHNLRALCAHLYEAVMFQRRLPFISPSLVLPVYFLPRLKTSSRRLETMAIVSFEYFLQREVNFASITAPDVEAANVFTSWRTQPFHKDVGDAAADVFSGWNVSALPTMA